MLLKRLQKEIEKEAWKKDGSAGSTAPTKKDGLDLGDQTKAEKARLRERMRRTAERKVARTRETRSIQGPRPKIEGSRTVSPSLSDSSICDTELCNSEVEMEGKAKHIAKKRKRSQRESDEEEDVVEIADAPVEERKGRGRPPKTGEYIGWTKAKEEYNRIVQEEMYLKAEKEL